MAKKLFIKTYGCQMNVYDSARMADVLTPLGFEATESPTDADLVILNTCHIREKAAEKVYSELGRLRRLKAERAVAGDGLMIAVAGCVAQAEGEEMLRRAPFVDIVAGPQTYHRLADLVTRAMHGNGGVVDAEFPVESKFDHLPEMSTPAGVSAFLTVQEGCDQFCTFCVVPYTRGAEYSRPVADVIAEARRLVARGAREITLLGQNVNAYHGRDGDGAEVGLGALVKTLAALPGLARIRYTTSHPRDMDEGLLAAHGAVAKLMPFVHLPVQSGSDRVLRAMNRRHSADGYRRIVERLRVHRPDVALSSDFFVGFPGETDADFDATMDLVREIGFAQAYTFKYSARPGTPAAEAQDQVPEPVREARLSALQSLLAAQQAAFNRASIGRRMDVLFERPGRRAGQAVGRSPYNQAVHVNAPESLIGAIRTVEVVGAQAHSLHGALVAAERACS